VDLKIKLFPKMVSNASSIFSFKNSAFGHCVDKVSTARVVATKEFNIEHSYTIESSFFTYCEKNEQQKAQLLGEKEHN